MTRFAIPDMICQGCIASVTRAVQGVDPTAKVDADLGSHSVEIESRIAPDALAAAIADAGFTVRPAA